MSHLTAGLISSAGLSSTHCSCSGCYCILQHCAGSYKIL